MVKIAYFDCFSGISGDMAVGALIDAGVPLQVVQDGLALLGLEPEVTLQTRVISRSQIFATKFDVLISGQPAHSVAEEHHHHHHHTDHDHAEHEHGHHEHAEHKHAEHEHEHDHGVGHLQGHHHASYAWITGMIGRSALPEEVKQISTQIFRAIGIAEARIHNSDLANVHFHEVGAADSIADIVAVALCLHHLGVEEVYSSAVPLGSGGMIHTQHGYMPLPAPASLEILKGYPTMLTNIPFELTTPTGAGIIKALSKGMLGMEQLRVQRIGFGAGTRELPDRPNLLRVIVGERVGEQEHDTVVQIQANIDDMNPQIYPYVIEQLLGAGALEAFLTPVIMKKGRPGMVLTVLAQAGAADELTRIIYRETTTIGVRFSQMQRRKLARQDVLVETEYGPVHMKKTENDGTVRLAPEYTEAHRIAREQSLPLRDVIRRLEDAARLATGQAGPEPEPN